MQQYFCYQNYVKMLCLGTLIQKKEFYRIKTNAFWGDLVDVLAKKEPLLCRLAVFQRPGLSSQQQ